MSHGIQVQTISTDLPAGFCIRCTTWGVHKQPCTAGPRSCAHSLSTEGGRSVISKSAHTTCWCRLSDREGIVRKPVPFQNWIKVLPKCNPTSHHFGIHPGDVENESLNKLLTALWPWVTLMHLWTSCSPDSLSPHGAGVLLILLPGPDSIETWLGWLTNQLNYFIKWMNFVSFHFVVKTKQLGSQVLNQDAPKMWRGQGRPRCHVKQSRHLFLIQESLVF